MLVPNPITHLPHQYVQDSNSSLLALSLLRPRRVRHSRNRLNGASQGRQEREVVQIHYVERVDPSKGDPKNGGDTTLNKYREASILHDNGLVPQFSITEKVKRQ